MILETNLGESFPISQFQFLVQKFVSTIRFDRTYVGGGILLYIRENIVSDIKM